MRFNSCDRGNTRGPPLLQVRVQHASRSKDWHTPRNELPFLNSSQNRTSDCLPSSLYCSEIQALWSCRQYKSSRSFLVYSVPKIKLFSARGLAELSEVFSLQKLMRYLPIPLLSAICEDFHFWSTSKPKNHDSPTQDSVITFYNESVQPSPLSPVYPT